jgi:hypothetical protein
MEWRALLAPVAGPPRQQALAPEAREGILWEFYRVLAGAGWRLDATGYATAFRWAPRPACAAARPLPRPRRAVPPSLACCPATRALLTGRGPARLLP